MISTDLSDSSKRKSTSQLKKPSIRRPSKRPRIDEADSNLSSQIKNNVQDFQQPNPSNVAQHYNKLSEQSRTERQNSSIINIRQFNNWIKSVLIAKYVRKNDVVLDFCCGKGGDLMKYKHAEIREWHGIDIADNSVRQALQRYINMNAPFKANFYVGDLTSIDLPSQLPNELQFSVAACQFALHYSWKDEASARTFFKNAVSKLKPNGHFIVTTTDAYVLKHKLLESEDNIIQNSVSEARFKSKDMNKSDGFFGIEYNFTLKERIENCSEYIVHPRMLISLAKDYGMEVVENFNFHQFFQRYADEFLKLTKNFRITELNFTEDEWDTIYLYRVFVFQKQSNPEGKDNMLTSVPNAYIPQQHQQGSDFSLDQDQIIYLK